MLKLNRTAILNFLTLSSVPFWSFLSIAPQGRVSWEQTSDNLRIMLTCLYAVSSLFALVGNSLGLYIIWRRCGVKAATHLLIANLALSNLLISIIDMPMSVAFVYIGHRWLAGLAGTITCKLAQYLFVFPIATSILTILMVSVDRFFAVFRPLQGQVFRRPVVMTTTIWICSALLMSPALVIFQAIPDGEWYCEMDFGENPHTTATFSKVYYIFLFAVLYLLPLLAITVLYTLVGCKLYHRKIPGDAKTCSRSAAVKRSKHKVMKVLVMIVATFAVCWFPAHVSHYIAVFHHDLSRTIPKYVYPLLLWFSHTNSAIDPFLYILLSQNFRREFRKVMNQCDFYQKRKRFEMRLSRLRENFSRRRSQRKSAASSFWSFRQGATYKGGVHDADGKCDAHDINMLSRSPGEQRRGERSCNDHQL